MVNFLRVTLSGVLCLIFFHVKGQVTIDPVFATENDSVVITFDATQGNAALLNQTQVYAHTGVITSKSSSPTDWKYVQGNWGTAEAKVKMTNIGNNKHQISYRIRDFYAVPSGETVSRLAFVFRDAAGTNVGRATDGSDIFVDLYTAGLAAKFTSPNQTPSITKQGNNVIVSILASEAANIKLFSNGTLVFEEPSSATLNYTYITPAVGKYELTTEVTKGALKVYDTTYFVVQGNPVVQNPPAGLQLGVNYINSTTVILQSLAPGKNFMYAFGDFSNWQVDPKYLMKKATNDSIWWIQIDGLTAGKEYGYQFLVNDELARYADPYSQKVLDPWNDPYIPEAIYPATERQYPQGKTTGVVSVFQTDAPQYNWDNTINFTPPTAEKLVVYELLVRDFVGDHAFKSVMDSLGYLQKLGINCIHLLPVMEFEGNISWGYNPAFFMSLDKYYGTRNAFKKLVEEAHRKGIAIVLDIAMNHSFGQNPQVQMYFDANAGQYGKPAYDNPWFNRDAKHDFNVGYDYNHEAYVTRLWAERVYKYWVQEYRIDGYRMDLSKGYTQKNTLGNIGAWGAYDQNRINILQNIGNAVWSVKPNAIMILEHFADNSEEVELSNRGFLLWGNINHNFNELTLGYASDVSSASYKSRGYSKAGLLSYMESHDEERMMYKNLQFGNSSNSAHNVKSLNVALARMEAAAIYFFSIPGPKMMWQFGEMGYDFALNRCEDGTIKNDCRTSPKPVRWDYYNNTNRRKLLNIWAAILKLRTTEEAFSTNNFQLDAGSGSKAKKIRLNHSSMDVIVMANFDVADQTINPDFQYTGVWYEYFSNTSTTITNTQSGILLKPGEYRIYTSKKLPEYKETFTLGNNISVQEIAAENQKIEIYPNPATDKISVQISSVQAQTATLALYDMGGKEVLNWGEQKLEKGNNALTLDLTVNGVLKEGIYLLKAQGQTIATTQKLIISK